MSNILGPDGKPIKRVDCTVSVNCIHTRAHVTTDSWKEGNLKPDLALFEKRIVAILKAHDGKMHISDFLKEYERRYGG